MPNNYHENILIEGLHEGNEKIFDYLFHLYYSGMVVYVMKFVPERIIAEDIVQDFFVRLWISRQSLVIKQSIKSYFYTSIKNRCIDYIRHQQVINKAEKDLAEQFETTHDERDLLIESELYNYINLALEKLPPACREIFIMSRFDGLKMSEIAERKGISVRTVEGHIGKALRIMRKELEPYLPAALIITILNNMSFQ
jgi:RNA polymerase sigma-70 factor, ECF subfamily